MDFEHICQQIILDQRALKNLSGMRHKILIVALQVLIISLNAIADKSHKILQENMSLGKSLLLCKIIIVSWPGVIVNLEITFRVFALILTLLLDNL